MGSGPAKVSKQIPIPERAPTRAPDDVADGLRPCQGAQTDTNPQTRAPDDVAGLEEANSLAVLQHGGVVLALAVQRVAPPAAARRTAHISAQTDTSPVGWSARPCCTARRPTCATQRRTARAARTARTAHGDVPRRHAWRSQPSLVTNAVALCLMIPAASRAPLLDVGEDGAVGALHPGQVPRTTRRTRTSAGCWRGWSGRRPAPWPGPTHHPAHAHLCWMLARMERSAPCTRARSSASLCSERLNSDSSCIDRGTCAPREGGGTQAPARPPPSTLAVRASAP